jgi:hypothetical protein
MVGGATYSRRCIHVVSNCCNTSKKKRKEKKNFPELKHKKTSRQKERKSLE